MEDVRLHTEHPLGRAWADTYPDLSPLLHRTTMPAGRFTSFESLSGRRRPRRGWCAKGDWRELLHRHTTLIADLQRHCPAGYFSRFLEPEEEELWLHADARWDIWAEVKVAVAGHPVAVLATLVTWPEPWTEWWLRQDASDELIDTALIARDLSWIFVPGWSGVDVVATPHLQAELRNRHPTWLPPPGQPTDT